MPRAPYSSPRSSVRSQRRAQPQRRRLEVVVQGLADGVRVAAPQRGHQLLGDGRFGDLLAARADLVELRVDVRRRQPAVGVREHPLVPTARQHRRDPLASPAADGDAAGQTEGHVGCRARRPSRQAPRAWRSVPHSASQASECARGIRAAACEPAGYRNRLVDRSARPRMTSAALASSRAACTARLASSSGTTSSPSPVTLIVNSPRSAGRALISSYRRSPGRPWRGGDSRRAPAAPTLNPRLIFAGPARSRSSGAHGDQSSVRASGAQRSRTAHPVGERVGEPGEVLDGQPLAASRRVEAGGPDRARPPRVRADQARARAARSILRRWANAASTTCEDLVPRRPSAARWVAPRHRDQTGVDVRRRPEDIASDDAGPADVGVPGRLDARYAVDPTPAAGASRSATSSCTITSTRSIEANVASRCSSTGTATL